MRRELGMLVAGLIVAGAVTAGAVGTAQAACEPDKVATKYPGLAGKTLKVTVEVAGKDRYDALLKERRSVLFG